MAPATVRPWPVSTGGTIVVPPARPAGIADPPDPTQLSPAAHGAAVVCYLLAGHGTARLDLTAVDRADACLAGLTAGDPGLLPAVRARYSDLRHQLAGRRRRLEAGPNDPPPGAPVGADRPPIGPMAPLDPPAPTRPGPSTYAEPAREVLSPARAPEPAWSGSRAPEDDGLAF